MKVTQDHNPFKPVTITLETRTELYYLLTILKDACNDLSYLAETRDFAFDLHESIPFV